MVRRTSARYLVEPDIAAVGALIGKPARAAMLLALLDERAWPAAELAWRGGVSPQAASAHLAKLVAGGLLEVSTIGRQRLFRLAGPDAGHAVEALAAIARPAQVVALSQTTALQRLRAARSCYDHLAGRLGVALTAALVARDVMRPAHDAYEVTPHGERFFAALDIDLASVRAKRRSFARACTDWTERRPHLAGSLGASLRERFLRAGWLERNPHDRALRITPSGRHALTERFAVLP